MLVLRGANWTAAVSVVTAAVEGDFVAGEWPAALELLDRLLPPGLQRDRLGEPPQSLAAAIETIADQICAWGGFPPSPIRRRPAARRWAALPIGYSPLTRAAMELAAALLNAVREGDADRWASEAQSRLLPLRVEADDHLATTRRFIARAAEARGIPCRPVSYANPYLLIGEGRHGRRMNGASTWTTSAIALKIAGNKRFAHHALARAGVPVARQRTVASLDAARAAMGALGLPMVIKPETSRKQGGVSFVFRPEDLEGAFAHSRQESDELLAESWLPGREFRVLVIDGEIVSAVESEAARVIGDGESTIEALVATANRDRRRGPRDQGFPLSPILFNDLAIRFLAHQGMRPDHVPSAGAVVDIYPLPMMRFGGGHKQEIADRIHPDTRDMLLRATMVLGLDVAGIDLRTPDAARSWHDVGAGLCEVNPQPNLTVHYNVANEGRDVAGILLDRLYPPSVRHRMAHVVIVSDADRSAAGRRLADALTAAAGWRVALLEPGSADLAGYRPATSPRSSHQAQGMAIEDPTLDGAVHLMRPTTIAQRGLGLGHAAVMLIDTSAGTPEPALRLVIGTAKSAGATALRMPATDSVLVSEVLSILAPRWSRDPAASR